MTAHVLTYLFAMGLYVCALAMIVHGWELKKTRTTGYAWMVGGTIVATVAAVLLPD